MVDTIEKSVQVLVLHEKHGDRYIYLPSPNDIPRILFKVFQERDSEEDGYGSCYDEEEMEPKELKFYQEAKKGNIKAAQTFMNLRSDHEYEGFEVDYLEVL